MKKPSKIQQRLAGNHFPSPNRFPNTSTVIKARVSEKQAAADQEAVEAPRRVIFMSRAIAAQHRYNEAEDVLISISDTDKLPPEFLHQPKEILYLNFHDHVDIRSEKLGHRWIQHEQAMQLARFVQKHTDMRNIIVHCNYGESRSKAAALAIRDSTNRSLLRANDSGFIVPYHANGDVGNQRVYSLVSDMLLHALDEDLA